jgi:predicted CXXCH cytochrome family protein
MAALFGAGVAVFLVLQAALVPEGFGAYGHYRAGALADNQRGDAVHAGRAACAECHSDAAAALKAGRHAAVGCEACHGALGRHAAQVEEAVPQRPEGRALCLRCHAASVGRPSAFPQVDVKEHAAEGACTECHTAHSPGP